MAKKNWATAFTSLFIESDSSTGKSKAPQDDEDVDISALLAETRAMTAQTDASSNASAPSAAAPAPAPAPTPAPVADNRLVIGQPLVELYQTYGVPPSPKTAEEILTFLEGLAAMPQTVQNQALQAMDHADPTWTLADVVQDGRNKVDALTKAKGSVDSQVAAANQEAADKVAAQEAYLTDATKTIDDQIAALNLQISELQQLLSAEQAQVAERKQEAQASLSGLAEKASTEHQRIDKEIERLSSMVRVFGPMAQEP